MHRCGRNRKCVGISTRMPHVGHSQRPSTHRMTHDFTSRPRDGDGDWQKIDWPRPRRARSLGLPRRRPFLQSRLSSGRPPVGVAINEAVPILEPTIASVVNLLHGPDHPAVRVLYAPQCRSILAAKWKAIEIDKVECAACIPHRPGNPSTRAVTRRVAIASQRKRHCGRALRVCLRAIAWLLAAAPLPGANCTAAKDWPAVLPRNAGHADVEQVVIEYHVSVAHAVLFVVISLAEWPSSWIEPAE